MNFFLLIIAIVSSLLGLGSLFIVIFQPRRNLTKLSNLNEHIRQAKQERKALISDVDKLNQEKLQLETSYGFLSTSLQSIKAELETFITKLSSSKDELESLGRKFQTTKGQVKSSQSELELLKNMIEAYKEEASTKEHSLESIRNEFKQAKKQLAKAKQELDLIKTSSSILQDQKINLEKENSHLSREVAKKKITYGTTIKQYKDETGDNRAVKHIGYKPCSHYSQDSYPLVFMPKEGAVIKFPRKGRLGVRGFTEIGFEDVLKTYFLRQRDIQVYSDRFLMVSDNTRPFEPDFTLIDERNGLNLFIDIEIDEPYDGINRFATHYHGQDEFRNRYFTDRGWVVIRFSEKQIQSNSKGCARLIAEVVKCVNPEFTIPHDLLSIKPVAPEPVWSKLQSEKWEAEDFRESYLGISSFTETQKILIDAANLYQNESETAVEDEIPYLEEDKQGNDTHFNIQNRHHRDSRIKFFPKEHLYLIDDNPRAISASSLVRLFFAEFDSDYWAARKGSSSILGANSLKQTWATNNKKAAELGTKLHLDIEKFFESNMTACPDDSPEFDQFLDFIDNIPEDWKIYRTEWRIFDDFHYVAGTADMLLLKPDGTYVLLDWKRSQNIRESNQYQTGISICSDLDDCNYNHYCLQLNVYKKILEDFYSKPISEMKFIQFHPSLEEYEEYEVEDMQEYVEKMFDAAVHIK